MYALEMLLVACGILAFRRALESPTLGRLAMFALIVALLALHAVLGVLPAGRGRRALLVVLAWRGAHTARRAPDAGRDARSAGCAFLPWLPTFLYQRAHTGTPWGDAGLPGRPARLHAARLRAAADRDRRRAGCSSSCSSRCCCSACSAARSTTATSRSTSGPHPARALAGVRRRRDARRRADAQLPRRRRVPVAVQRDRVPVLRRAWSRGASRRSPTRGCSAGVLVVVVGARVRRRRAQRRRRNRTRPAQVAARAARPTPSPATSSCTAPTSSAPRCTGSRRRVSTRSCTRRSRRPSSSTGSTTRSALAAPIPRRSRARRSDARANARIWLVTTPGYITHPVVCDDALDDAGREARPRSCWSLPTTGSSRIPACNEFPARTTGG